MHQEDFSPFDLIRILFHVDAFSDYAADLKQALNNEDGTRTLRTILVQHQASKLLDLVNP